VTSTTLDRSVFELEFEDAFDGDSLDERRWLPHYLPHWSTPDRTAARHEIRDGHLRLLIEADQPPWCPELDGDLRVSSIQTAVFAGPVGTAIGQHRFAPGAVVRTEQVNRTLYTLDRGLTELRARALDDPRVMVALWMIGVGDNPVRSGEICVAEIFGRDVRPDGARVGMGIHPFEDPDLVDDFTAVDLSIDVRMPHTYSASWTADGVAWYVDDRLVRVVDQSPGYPLQLMLGIYEFPANAPDQRRPADYPKAFAVDWVRGYRLR
jgi:Glycosyl hydrolases family 16